MAPRKEGQGGKLNRSEIVQARLSAKTRYAAELMSRKQLRTLSSTIEYVVGEAAKTAKVEIAPSPVGLGKVLPARFSQYKEVTIAEAVELTRHHQEHQRFVAMAERMPHLLSSAEESLWSLIQATDYFWSYYQVDSVNTKGEVVGKQWLPHKIIPEHLQAYWEKMTCGKSFDIGELPNGRGKEIAKPKGAPATAVSFLDEEDDAQALNMDDDDPTSDPEFWELWIQEIIKHSTEETEIQQTENGTETIRKFYLPSTAKQKALMKKAIKIWEKKRGA